MITREQAGQIAAEVLGSSPGTAEQGWDLVEFGSGWLIQQPGSHRGAVGLVVERDSGRVMRFPSYVPTGRILEEYGQVVADARTVREPGEPLQG
jgi:hypothetical protein